MPPVVAAVAAVVGSEILATIIVQVVLSLAISVVLGAISSAITKKPSAPNQTPQLQDRTVMVKQPITPWSYILGQVKVSGAITFMASYASNTPGGSSGDGPVSIAYSLVGSSPVEGQYSVTAVNAGQHTYSFSSADAGIPIVINYRTSIGIGSQSFNIPATTPWQIDVFTPSANFLDQGVIATKPVPTTTSSNTRLEMVITLAGHPVDSIGDVFFGNELIQLDGLGNAIGRWARNATVIKGTGTPSSDQAFNTYGRQQAPDLWSVHHLQSGKTKLWVTFIYNSNLLSGSLPNVAATVSGLTPFDPRTSVTQWSSNPVLLLRQYLMLMGIAKADGSDMNDTVTIASANTCDEQILLANGGYENRYTCNGVIDSSQTPSTVIPNILGSFGGKLIYVGGKWNILVGVYYTPSISFDEDDLDGNPTTTTKISMRETYNAVKGTYFNPGQDWQLTDFPDVENEVYQAQDGAKIYKDLQLEFTTSPSMAQRIGKILIEQTRQQITASWPMKLTAMQCQVGDVVYLNRTRLGWVNKPFEVTDWGFSVRGSGDAMRLGIDVTFRETASGVYDWNSGLETTVDLAPNTTLPDPFVVPTPGVPVIITSLYQTRANQPPAIQAVVSWSAVVDAFVVSYQLEYRITGSPAWTIFPLISDTTFTILDIAPDTYDFRVKAINHIGAQSAYNTTSGYSILGGVIPPADITGLMIQAISNLAYLRWDQPTDPDITLGGSILVRHTQASLSTATWEQSVSAINSIPGISDHAVVPLKAGTYLVKAVNAYGTVSNDVAAVSTTNAQTLLFSPIGVVEEDPNFYGVKTGLIVSAGNLQLDVDGSGNVVPTGNYLFAAGIDNQVVPQRALRFTTNLVTLAVNVHTLFDSRAGNVDTWDNWDGTGGGTSVDAIIYIRYTDQDPNNTLSTWSDWTRLVTADYLHRAYQYKLVLTSTDPAINIYVSALGITAQQT